MMETKNWKQIIVLVGGILVGIVTGTIITAHHFGKMGGRAFPEFIFCGTAGILIASEAVQQLSKPHKNCLCPYKKRFFLYSAL